MGRICIRGLQIKKKPPMRTEPHRGLFRKYWYNISKDHFSCQALCKNQKHGAVR